MEKREMHTTIFVGKSEETKSLGKTTCRWEDNIKMDLEIIGCEDVDWIHLAQERIEWWALVRTVTTI
jgi:hypothetical protein